MSKKTLKQKIYYVKWSAVSFFIVYFVIGAILTKSGSSFDSEKTYNLLTNSLTLTAYFLGPVAAFVLFSDWREQHNKQVRNEFALKVFRQFELFEKSIQEACLINIEMDNLVPDECREYFNGDRLPIYLNDRIFKDNNNLILSFIYKIRESQELFNVLLDDIRYFGIVSSNIKEIASIASVLLVKFQEVSISDEENDSYSEYLHLLEINSRKLNGYYELRNEVSDLLITDLLKTLNAD